MRALDCFSISGNKRVNCSIRNCQLIGCPFNRLHYREGGESHRVTRVVTRVVVTLRSILCKWHWSSLSQLLSHGDHDHQLILGPTGQFTAELRTSQEKPAVSGNACLPDPCTLPGSRFFLGISEKLCKGHVRESLGDSSGISLMSIRSNPSITVMATHLS